jgi:hypothetical protein
MEQVLGVWTDLMHCYYGKNSFGGDTAEAKLEKAHKEAKDE